MKIVLSSVIAFLTLTLLSCSKDYECICYLNGEEVYNYSITAQHEQGAKDQCADKESTLDLNYKCTIN